MEVEPLTPGIGALVHGVDLGKPLSDAAFEEVHAAWMDHLVLFMRDQHMTPAAASHSAAASGTCTFIPRRPTRRATPR